VRLLWECGKGWALGEGVVLGIRLGTLSQGRVRSLDHCRGLGEALMGVRQGVGAHLLGGD